MLQLYSMVVCSMKSNKLIIIIVIVTSVIIGVLTFFINSFKKDQLQTQKIMNTIIDKYDRFEDKVLDFNDIRESTYKIVFKDIYYDSLKENYENFNNKMHELEKSVNTVIKQSSELKKYCKNYYSDSSVNTKCSTFKNLYEEVNNSFVSDVNKYNELLTNYNNYLKENGNNSGELVLYKSDKKYIDFNKDKEYSGKE